MIKRASIVLIWLITATTSKIIKRNDRIWVFGSGKGKQFTHNSKYLYLHIANKKDTEIRPVWLSDDPDVVIMLRENGYEAYESSSLKGAYFAMRAKFVFITNWVDDIPFWYTGGATTVMLWHGIASKRLGWDTPQKQGLSTAGKFWFKFTCSIFNFIVVTSTSQKPVFSSAFGVEEKNVLPLGYPRNDIFRSEIEGSELGVDYMLKNELVNIDKDKTIGYLPTWRKSTNFTASNSNLNLEKIDRVLKKHDAHLVIKLHLLTPAEFEDSQYENINCIPSAGDIYPVLHNLDVLITDYSSVYFDYLYLDHPIIFYPYDIDDYRENRGFYFEYEQVTPGPICEEFDELICWVEKVCRGVDGYSGARDRLRAEFFEGEETLSSERIFQYFAKK